MLTEAHITAHTYTHTQRHMQGELVVQLADCIDRLYRRLYQPRLSRGPHSLAIPTFLFFCLTAHLCGAAIYFGSLVSAKYRLKCVEHITSRGPYETASILAQALR